MSEHDTHDDHCSRFEDWLLEGAEPSEGGGWRAHLESCPDCRSQWESHQMLITTFAAEAVPILSPAFQAGLDRKLASAVNVEPLTGWRRAALLAYAAAALGLLAWILDRFPLPRISIDYSSSWTVLAALALVPLSLWVVAGITRVLPSLRRATGARLLAF